MDQNQVPGGISIRTASLMRQTSRFFFLAFRPATTRIRGYIVLVALN